MELRRRRRGNVTVHGSHNNHGRKRANDRKNHDRGDHLDECESASEILRTARHGEYSVRMVETVNVTGAPSALVHPTATDAVM